jgi:hypothetical protein
MMQTTSRSAVDTRRKCETKRFFEYDYAGTGLSPATGAALPLAGGIALHNMMAQALEAAWLRRPGGPRDGKHPPFEGALDVIIHDGIQRYVEEVKQSGGFLNQPPGHVAFLIAEQSALIEGLVRGWVRYRMPDILAHYDVVSIEQEQRAQLTSDFTLPLRLDVLLRSKVGGHLTVLDYKTHAYERETWAATLRNSSQTHLYIPAVEKLYGEHCAGVQYEGLFKGARKRGTGRFDDRKLQQSKLCYGYLGPGGVWEVDYTKKKGFAKEPVWEHMTVTEWLDKHLSPLDLQVLFQTVPPHRPTPQAMREEVESTARKEREWAQRVAPGVRLSLVAPEEVPAWAGVNLEKNRDACHAYGADHRCALWDICNNRTVAADPLGSELFKPREDHHTDEEAKEAA